MEAHFANLISEVAAAQDIPLTVEGGVCSFEYQDVDFLLEVPKDAGLAIFHAFFPADAERIPADKLLRMNHEYLSEKPSFFSYDPLGNSVVFSRAVPLAAMSSADLYQEILDFTGEVGHLSDKVFNDEDNDISADRHGPTEGWIRG